MAQKVMSCCARDRNRRVGDKRTLTQFLAPFPSFLAKQQPVPFCDPVIPARTKRWARYSFGNIYWLYWIYSLPAQNLSVRNLSYDLSTDIDQTRSLDCTGTVVSFAQLCCLPRAQRISRWSWRITSSWSINKFIYSDFPNQLRSTISGWTEC